jgi:hypothetical protein
LDQQWEEEVWTEESEEYDCLCLAIACREDASTYEMMMNSSYSFEAFDETRKKKASLRCWGQQLSERRKHVDRVMASSPL